VSVVVDANLLLAIVIPLPFSEAAREKIIGWKADGEGLLAPQLWEYEVTSALRRAVFHGLLESDRAVWALNRILLLNVESIPPSTSLHQASLSWAERLDQSRAYDAQYLALAAQSRLDFWTADQRLVNAAQRAGAQWVHWVGESV
jgi:predicted nucleic acid-binding protein